ncbi:MAG: ester cyclase [Actinobacteria bacterium]|nr:ester cyclase [Actinomycetota bacterium]
MASDKPEAIVRKYFVLHSPISDEPIRGIEGFKEMIATYRAATPELKVKVQDLKVDGDTVVTRWSARYKHTGDFDGHAPTGKEGDINGSDTIRIVDGKIVEVRNNLNLEDAESQVGFKPKLKKKS